MSASDTSIGSGLNPAQKEAVLYLDGPCLVLAGAGSGKTRVITQKMAYLLRECGYMGRNVVALTFTNKAAREMAERVKTLVDPKLAKGLTISTFHALGVRLLREEAAHAGLKPQFSILDADDAMSIIQELLATTDRGRLREVQSIISLWKNALLTPDQAAAAAITPTEVEAVTVYRGYAATLAAYQAVDFDDLIRIPAELLERNEEVRTRWQNRVRYLLVDEYQDTNVCQYRLVQLLTGVRAMFTAVGDDDQAIYAWRGATIENLAKLTTDYPSLKLIKLEQNYRSVQRILAAANNVIERNPKLFEKKLWSDLGHGEPIIVSPMNGDEHEAESIAMKVSAARFERQAQWKDFAILYRSNHQSRVLEQALRNLKIPYTISGGQSFFDKAEVRDILAYLRLVANDEDDPAFIRAATTPKRGIGQGTLQTLGQYAAQRQCSLLAAVDEAGLESLLAPRQLEPLRTFAEFVRRIQWRAGRGVEGQPARAPEPAGQILDDLLSAIQYERYLYDMLEERPAQTRWQNVLELTGWLKRKAEEDGMTLFDLVQHVALVTMLERGEEEEPDAVKLSTLHASKGLEYPHVYLAGVEEGLLPHLGKDDEDSGDPARAAETLATRIQEERRLMYVGITRAQRSLNLSWCKKRRRAREDVVREPSRFIEEMGLGDAKVQEDEATRAMSPKERLGMLKALLKKD
ncbi:MULTISPECIES: UvrD-helicase domain-containing protein [Bordetella]|uniref:ATP-dependent DNA helicase Rep n=1 Tax=Bordetella genomosp. 6 TaxID=463024 RepID=A0ABX4FE49_9BORD|nr:MULTISPECIES: UvrD-helicase domain-containing protein [Bordetella]AOB28695.1 ATP-dependent DNA helicase Rep [Bordetella bronchiseptica]AZW46044.1 ATP-dependent DNA helicase Rep [Bordetella bronchiseptica]KCV66588.1 putative ATP-dependent DNA helicase Rep [Bordetella bronchiseptica 99-R-0433]OZI80471.1 ATP-dependent DNA helicase Rep [Bordetella genomosp. 6]